MSIELRFHDTQTRPSPRFHTAIIGRCSLLGGVRLGQWLKPLKPPTFDAMVRALNPGDSGDWTTTWSEGPPPVKWFVGCLPDACSRHNTPTRAHALTQLLSVVAGGRDPLQIVVALEDPSHARALACAVARAFPLFSLKNGRTIDRHVDVWLLPPGGHELDLESLDRAARAVRQAASLVDQPPNLLHVPAFVQRAHEVAEGTGATIEVLDAATLVAQGYGGIAAVGQAAEHGPALVILRHEPPGASRAVAWVGKGIVFDTGGLSIKPKTAMPGMKQDMGGAAAVLTAFEAAATGGCPDRLYAVLCLAENAVGPNALRPDDIITLYSGRTVEVNNTDAEGRLVLADGVAHAVRHLAPDLIIDVATLTGAQLIATGKRHAAVMSNQQAWEDQAVQAGRQSGDLVFPIPYAPEFFRQEFSSKVADLKNSVKDRNNAQASCAGQFIAEHLMDYQGAWVHLDIAGPADNNGRGTGFGVPLLLEMMGYR